MSILTSKIQHHLLLLEVKFRSDLKRRTTTSQPVEGSAWLESPAESSSPGTAGTGTSSVACFYSSSATVEEEQVLTSLS